MATSAWIESAAAAGRSGRGPAATFSEPSAIHVTARPRAKTPQQQQDEALEHDLARLCVRRLGNRHGCPGRCDKPEHARDVAAAREALDALFAEPQPKRKNHKKRSTV